ncbi:S24 family peptidase [Limosilactobacillus reuteri]|uniref:S24 family peptidase n=1 Tax=Limosilactobacillus reuteri TaxID=1598 RepID=UPI00128E8F6B|nr:S24 family peptidase [Limosilactobacillus reuteri]MQB75048.1 transcriptional regulator [Limosilactobacillus reuteri]MQB92429.1 transcriptional regulator [Limosilactobacillus reuteri]
MKSTADRLKQIMSERGLKQVDILNMSEPFQKSLDISMGKSTLSQYVSGKQSPDQPRLYLLAKTLDVSEPWLMGFDVERSRRLEDTLKLSDANSTKLIEIYNQLDSNRKNNVYNYAMTQLDKQKNAYSSSVGENRHIVYLYGAVSAGTGEYIPQDDDKPEKVIVEGVVPDHDFAVRVNGDSMEPLFADQQIIYVNKADKSEVRNHQFVIAELNGEFFIKKLQIDDGSIKLISLNKKYSDIQIHDYDDFIIRGIVII